MNSWGLRTLRYGLRTLSRSRGFTLVAVLTLALGIGSAIAIFTVLRSVVLQPLPYPEATRLIYVDSRVPGEGPGTRWGLSVAGYFFLREQSRTLEDLGVFLAPTVTLTGDGPPARITGAFVSASLLRALRAAPVTGRVIHEADDIPDRPSIVVLSHDLWQSRYGGDPGVVGSMIQLNARPYEVVGVMRRGVHLPEERVDVWLPLGLDPAAPAANSHFLNAIARHSPGVELEEVNRELAALSRRLPEAFPEVYTADFMRESGFVTAAQSLRDYVVGDFAGTLWILLAGVGVVFLIACANVANLFLVRSGSRRAEIGVRLAMGASRGHILRHLFTVAALISVLAGACGVMLAQLGIWPLVNLAPADLPRIDEVRLGSASLLFAIGLIVLTQCALVAPIALQLRTPPRIGVLLTGRATRGSRGHNRLRGLLVLVQVAFSVVLLTGAALLVSSFQRVSAVDPGFEPEHILTLGVYLPSHKYETKEQIARFQQRLTRRIEALPQVARAASTDRLPPLRPTSSCSAVSAEDSPVVDQRRPPCFPHRSVSPGYFRAMGIPLVAGSGFPEGQLRPGVVVVSRSLAERLWPGQDAVGKRVKLGEPGPPYYRVAGVVGDVRSEGLDQPPTPLLYLPLLPTTDAAEWAFAGRGFDLIVRTPVADPATVAAPVRATLAELDPDVPVTQVQTAETLLADSLLWVSFAMKLLGIAALMATLLAAVGLYAVIAQVVEQQRFELGVRMALGASKRRVLWSILTRSLRLLLPGVLIGLVLTTAVTGVLQGLLFEVQPNDPLVLTVVGLALILVGMAATFIPASRATSVDPIQALRTE